MVTTRKNTYGNTTSAPLTAPVPAGPLSPVKLEFTGMSMQLLRKECKKRNIASGSTKEKTRARLRKEVEKGHVGAFGPDERLLHELLLRNLSYVGPDPHVLKKRLARYGSRGFSGMRIEDLRIACRNRRLLATGEKDTLKLRLLRYEFNALEDQFDINEWKKETLKPYIDDAQEALSENSQDESEYPKILPKKTDLTVQQQRAVASALDIRTNALRHSKYITHLQYHPDVVFAQQDVMGDGNCLYRAFAVAYYGPLNEDLWEEVRRRTRDCHRRVVGDPAHPRRRLYTELNVLSVNADILQRMSRTERAKSPTTRVGAQNLVDQLRSERSWGTLELMQVISDAFNAEIIAHTPSNAEEWGLFSRGDANAPRQIHLVQWSNHWTVFFPVFNATRFTRHLNPDSIDHRTPVPIYQTEEPGATAAGDAFLYQHSGLLPDPIIAMPRPWMDTRAVAIDAAAESGEVVKLRTLGVPPGVAVVVQEADVVDGSPKSGDGLFHSP